MTDSKKPAPPPPPPTQHVALKEDWNFSERTVRSSDVITVTNTLPAPPNPTRSAAGGKDKK